MSDKLKNFFNISNNVVNINQKNLKIDLSSLLFSDLQDETDNAIISRIDSLQVKNFRGFSQINPEDLWCRFDFTGKQKVIIYGPNWSGKSSFSEALEFFLTWDIKECKRKNKEVWTYIRNFQNLWKYNIIINNNEKLNITSKQKEFFKRCFIEKNRITEFSLFRSKDTGLDDYQDALTFLLWFEELDKFISSFVKAESFRLDIQDIAKKDLEVYQLWLKESKLIYEQKQKEYKALQGELLWTNILLDHDWCIQQNHELFNQLTKDISSLENDLKIPKISKNLYKHTAKDFDDLKEKKINKEEELNLCISEIKNKKLQINFKNLYEAIIWIPKWDICPACHTHKKQRARDPFSAAFTELSSMSEVIQLEDKKRKLETEIQEILDQQKQLDQEKARNQLQLALIIDEFSEEEYFPKIKQIFESPINIEEKQTKLENLKLKRQLIENKIYQYKILESEVLKWCLSDDALLKRKQHAVELENIFNLYLSELQKAYGLFRVHIEQFYKFFIKEETEGMWADVAHYYSKINAHDNISEKISRIEATGGWKSLYIKLFNSEWMITNDAISYLSEWHLRSLWLAVLWANMKKHNVPFMIFDDVINAIDAEHRSNIIEIIHKDEFLSWKQIILTTHDRLFWEKFCNSLSASEAPFRVSYILTKELWWIATKEYREINYDQKIFSSINNYDLRQAILYIRIWYEQIVLWFCKKKDYEVRGNIKRGTSWLHLETTLELLYDKFYQKIKLESSRDETKDSAYQELKKNIVNRQIINQEAHAHDEQTYNIIHSITSNEITNLLEKIRTLSNYVQKLDIN